ncbi:MAG: DNA replication complex subunit Gins51 [Candidatus Bathyarchaeota archaeon]
MYKKIYEAWKNEVDDEKLQPLPENFYQDFSVYIKNLREEIKGLDEKSFKYKLKQLEVEKSSELLNLLIDLRLKKIVKLLFEEKGEIKPSLLTLEEKSFYEELNQSYRFSRKLAKESVEGKTLKSTYKIINVKKANVVLRILSDIPALVGSDMKTYGPFKVEDVVAIPLQNIEKLVKHGYVKEVDVA